MINPAFHIPAFAGRFPFVRCALLCSVLLFALPAKAETLHIGAWDQKTDFLTMVAEAVLTRAYAELKQPVEFVELPIRRAMLLLASGELDGNSHRVGTFGQDHPEVYRVETPILYTRVSLYALSARTAPESWSQLSGSRLAFVRGVLHIEQNIPQGAQAVPANTIPDVFKMLKLGMADFAVFIEPEGSPVHTMAIAADIKRLERPLERIALHHYLLNRHSDIGARLNAVLKRMQNSGEMHAIAVAILQGTKAGQKD